MSRLSLSFVLILSLAIAGYSIGCPNCRPAVKIATCPDFKCYRCGNNQILILGTYNCDCILSYYRINGYCGKCPQGYEYNQIQQRCIGINPCPPNQLLVKGKCQCQPGLSFIQNFCQRCPEHQFYQPNQKACRCQVGYSLINGKCIIAICGDNQVYSESHSGCVCSFGHYLIAGVCSRCKTNQVYNENDQTCTPFIAPKCRQNQYFWECCCFCELGYIKIKGVCKQCPLRSSYNWNLDACVCDEGYYFVGEQIFPLPSKSVDTSSSLNSNPTYIYEGQRPSTGVSGSSHDGQNQVNTNATTITNVQQVVVQQVVQQVVVQQVVVQQVVVQQVVVQQVEENGN